MTDVVINLTDNNIEDAKNLLCREGESVSDMISRIIKAEIKSKKLRNDLGRK
jgi:hypothetical protein